MMNNTANTKILPSTILIGVVGIVGTRFTRRHSRIITLLTAIKRVIRTHTPRRRVRTLSPSLPQHLLLRIQLLRLQLQLLHLNLTALQLLLQSLQLRVVLLSRVTHLIELLLHLLPLLTSTHLLLRREKTANLAMQLRQLSLQLVMMLLLITDVVLPIHQLQIGCLNTLLQLLSPLYCSLYLYIGLLLLHLLLQPRQFRLQYLILRFMLIDLSQFRLIFIVLFLIVDRKRIICLRRVI